MNNFTHSTTTINSYNSSTAAYIENRPLVPPVIKLLNKFVSMLGTNKNVLDVGCGPGRDAQYMELQGAHVTGIDLSSELLNIAKTNSPQSTFMEMDMRKLNFPSNYFGGVWASGSLLHLHKSDMMPTVAEIARVQEKGSPLFIGIMSTPNLTAKVVEVVSENEMLLETPDFTGKPRLFSYYSPKEVEQILALDYENIEIESREESGTGTIWLNIFARRK